ncbi:hypothetical protein GcM3_002026 [Golovinomyces cichoracearum]|uniref:Reverse transcriptase RNase H-like domain-containing protein n=1 Tax=Golovinomyces cichoracearum TaxID=62708 RepID=A0A420JB89_9PEZI|nr:hypothetical protein GcM3_002026 [Golovinomyces cichoracearum]
MQPRIFLSRATTTAEKNYWSTELEVACLVWVVRKIRNMIEASELPVIFYTDHASTKGISSQTSLHTTFLEKLNIKLIKTFEYLQRFKPDVRYKAGRENVILDAILRLKVKQKIADQISTNPNYSELDAIDSLYGSIDIRVSNSWNIVVQNFHTTTVQLSDEINNRIRNAYIKDRHWSKFLKIILRNNSMGQNKSKLSFEINDNLIYHINYDTKNRRLCVPEDLNIFKIIFRLAHHDLGHLGYKKTLSSRPSGIYK